MSETTCGNLRAMPNTLRQRRDSSPARDSALRSRRSRRRSLGVLSLASWLAWGCGGEASRDPIPNPPPPAATDETKAETQAPLDDDAAAERYLEIKARFDADPAVVKGPAFPELKRSLDEIANGAAAKPMRANAALLLGAMLDVRGASAQAAGYYEHAATLVPDDAGPFMALAVAHAAAGNYAEAVKAQEDAARLDPDNLENWLALGELRKRAGDDEGSVQAYLAYEKRRKGIIDGLTLHDDAGTYVVDVEERVACAEALASAADQGTAVALVYALRTDPDPRVREAVARVMGLHRLASYQPALTTQATEEVSPEAAEAVRWALAEIERAPVEMDDTERPRLADDDPRQAEGEVPRAEEPPVAPTEATTVAPPGTTPAALGAKGEAPEGSKSKSQGDAPGTPPSPG